MSKYITKFTTTEEFNTSKSSLKTPHVSLTKDDMKVHYMPYDYSDRYLTFEALEDGTFQFTNAINYSIDGGANWISLTANTATPTITAGNKIMWKGELIPNISNYEGIGIFSSTGNFNVEGNVMSLLYGDNFIGQTDLTGKDFAFYGLFENCLKLINAEHLLLPTTTLVNNCYAYMFDECTSLITAPELPATTLADCCYDQMFSACTSLITAPELPATTLANYCYNAMFYSCTALTAAPDLPATTLAESCYGNMFRGCTALTTAPELPATTLESYCYNYMFQNCSNLNYIKAMFTTTPSTTYTSNWVSGVAASGTFVKNSAATWTTTGVNGIPNNWTIQTASS